jgi:hypothetical protein
MLKPKHRTRAVANLDTRDDDFETIHGHRVLRDGRSYRARLNFMDAQTIRDAGIHRQRPVTRVVAADGDPLSMHRPGWRVAATHDASDPLPRYGVTDADRKAVADSRAEYLRNLQDAWKTPATDARRKVQERNAKGQEVASFEEENEDNSDDITGAGDHGPKRRKRGDPGVIGAGVQEWKGELEPEEEDEDGNELEDAACPRSRRAPA